MRKLIWSPRARDDLLGIAACYDLVAPHLVDDMWSASTPHRTRCSIFPEIGPLTTAGARKWLAAKTPYLFLCDVSHEAVEIAAVEHERSNWDR